MMCMYVMFAQQLFQLEKRNHTQQRSRIINLLNKACSVLEEADETLCFKATISFSLTKTWSLKKKKQTAGNAGRLILNFLIMVGYL